MTRSLPSDRQTLGNWFPDNQIFYPQTLSLLFLPFMDVSHAVRRVRLRYRQHVMGVTDF